MLATEDIEAIAQRVAAILRAEGSAGSAGDDNVTSAGAAKILKVTRKTITRWALAGKLKGCRVGDDWRFARADVERGPVDPVHEAANKLALRVYGKPLTSGSRRP